MMKRILLSLLLALGVVGSAMAAKNLLGAVPFIHKQFQPNDFIKVDDKVIAAGWATPIEQVKFPFPYGIDELEAQWPTLMRGIKAPYPSADYLKTFYMRYPKLYGDVTDKKADWNQLSRQTLEVWWLFFKGDMKQAAEKGHAYGGVARVPAMFAEIAFGTYYAKTVEQKQHMLQDAANRAGVMAHLMDFKDNAEKYPEDFLRLRLVYVYAMGRGIEDATIPRLIVSSAPFIVIDVVNEILKTDPNHTLGLSVQGSIDSNVIRRMGKLGGKVASMSDGNKSKANYDLALKNVGDMSVLRMEYANTILYVDGEKGIDQAILNLWIASKTKAHTALEELDRIFAEKRWKEIKYIKDEGISFKKYDKQRAKYIRKNDVNIYAVSESAFIPNKNEDEDDSEEEAEIKEAEAAQAAAEKEAFPHPTKGR